MSDPHAPQPDDEPKTPMWLPALGAALFVGVALVWAVTPSSPTPAAPEQPVRAATAAATTTAPPARTIAPTPPGEPIAIPSARAVIAPGAASVFQQQLQQLQRNPAHR